jgi:hypothetical protein
MRGSGCVMLHTIKAKDIAWVAKAARRSRKRLVHEAPGRTWTKENLKLPGICRWTVSWICYEGLFARIWSERRFPPRRQDARPCRGNSAPGPAVRAPAFLLIDQLGAAEMAHSNMEASAADRHAE